jgi:hypothetical protein
MHIPAVYKSYIGDSLSNEGLTSQEGLLEELADLAYQLLKLFALQAQELTVAEATFTPEQLTSVDLGRGLARPESPLATALGGALADRFLGVQQVAAQARIVRNEPALQNREVLVAKILEEFAEAAQHLCNDKDGWLKRLSAALSSCLQPDPPVSSLLSALQALEVCAQQRVAPNLDLPGLVELVNLKMLGRFELNFQNVPADDAKAQIKSAELGLLRSWLKRHQGSVKL